MDAASLSEIVDLLLTSRKEDAHQLVLGQYPFVPIRGQKPGRSEKEKMKILRGDGFIDKYSGSRLINAGLPGSVTYFFPDDFP